MGNDCRKEETRFNKDLKSRYPIFHTWESSDPRFLTVEAVPLRNVSRVSAEKVKSDAETMVRLVTQGPGVWVGVDVVVQMVLN